MIPPKLALQLIQLRRNLKGTVATASAALQEVEALVATIAPKCRACFFQYGLVEECRCKEK